MTFSVAVRRPGLVLAIWVVGLLQLPLHGESASLIELSNEHATLKVTPHGGGRVVFYALRGFPNILLSDEALWDQPHTDFSRPQQWADYGGHTVWLGPQSDWWMKQETHPEKAGDIFPPDPFSELATYEVISQDAHSVHLRGPDSPLWHVRFDKFYTLHPDGSVDLRTSITNISEQPVSWGLWTVTILPGKIPVFVPLREGAFLRLEYFGAQNDAQLPWIVEEGFFRFLYDSPLPESAQLMTAKLFASPGRPYMAAFNAGQAFFKMIPRRLNGRVHPSHRPVEVYQRIARDPGQDRLELEAHGPYTTLVPGESTDFSVRWMAFPLPETPLTPPESRRLIENWAGQLGLDR